ncbi:Centrosomal protein [Amphibalanus amphitrite]|uniref:Centrosomal protein n=1 Tax=Amphibalanus amphitrite TaxID=1232801 RepID=A0A6A4VJ92_AMPAM|nr:Centrosomal protein [Amphibalanus amphitrite]
MGNVEPEECSGLLSARSSDQSSLGLIKLDSVAGLSGCLLEDDSLPSTRPALSPVKETEPQTSAAAPGRPSYGMLSFEEAVSENGLDNTGYDDALDATFSEGECTDGSEAEDGADVDGGIDSRYLRSAALDSASPADRAEGSSRCGFATDQSTLSFLDPSSLWPPTDGAQSPLPVTRSCPESPLSPALLSPPGVSALCLPASPGSPAAGGGEPRAVSPLAALSADVAAPRAVQSQDIKHPDIPPPAALSPVLPAPAPAPAATPADERSLLLASRYLRPSPPPAAVPGSGAGGGGSLMSSLHLSLPLDSISETGLGAADGTLTSRVPRLFVPAADQADISGQQISARSTSIGAARSPGSLPGIQDDTGFGGCFDGLEDFQKEFDAGEFASGGEAFKAELEQAEQSLDRNGLPMVDFSLASGTYDPHTKFTPSGCDESVNISQYLKAGSYPMGVLGDASNVEPPPRFSMSTVQTTWQSNSGRFPDEDFNSTSSTLPRSRETFSVSHGSGYSQIHGTGGPARVGTYTVLTAAGSAPDTTFSTGTGVSPGPVPNKRGGKDGAAEKSDTERAQSVHENAEGRLEKASSSTASSRGFSVARTASAEERYSRGGRSTEGSTGLHHAKKSVNGTQSETLNEASKATERSRASQDSQDASVTLVNASRPSQDSRDVTLTPERSRAGSCDTATPTTVRPRPPPRHSAALGDSLRRKIVDVLNRTEEARLQLLTPGRRTPDGVVQATEAAAAAVTVSQQLTVTEMISLSEQPLDDSEDGQAADPQPSPAGRDTSAPLSEDVSPFGSWPDGGEWPQAYSQARSDELKRRQEKEMAEHKQRQEERIQTARAQQAALRKQWEMEQELKEKVARQRKLQKKRDAKARRDSAASTLDRSHDALSVTAHHDVPSSPKPKQSSPRRVATPRRPVSPRRSFSKPKQQQQTPEKKGQQQPPEQKQQPPEQKQQAHQPMQSQRPSQLAADKPAPEDIPSDPPFAAPAVPTPAVAPPPPPASAPPPAPTAGAVDPERVSRILQELNAATASAHTPALSMQQVVEAVMRQLAMPDVSLDESCRSRTELNVTDILQELRGESEELSSQMARAVPPGGSSAPAETQTAISGTGGGPGDDAGGAATGSGKTGPKEATRLAESVSRLHRGVPARPRGEQPRRRSPVKRSASIPLQPAGPKRGTEGGFRGAATRRRPVSTYAADRGPEDASRRRPNSAQSDLAVRGRRVPRMGIRRQVDELTTDDSDRAVTARSVRGSPGKPGKKAPTRQSAAAAIAATAAAAARAAAVSTCPDSASSDGSARTYSIASDRAPGSLPAAVTEEAPESEPERPETAAATAPAPAPAHSASVSTAAPAALPATTSSALADIGMDYDSPEFLVALAARRYPSSTPSLARSVAAFVASESLDHVSPIVPADADTSEPSKEADGPRDDGNDDDSGAETGTEARSEVGGDVGKPAAVTASGTATAATAPAATAGQETRVEVLVPPPTVWPSEESALEMRPTTGTSSGSMATTATSAAARPSLSSAAPLQTQPEEQPRPVAVTGSTSAEVTGAAARPRRSRIPTPVRQHVSDMAAATCQSAPCLLQSEAAMPPPPPPPALPSAVPAAAAGRRPAAALSGGDRQTGPRPALRACNSVGSTRDSGAQTGLSATSASQRHNRLVRSASAQARPGEPPAGSTATSEQIQTDRGQRGSKSSVTAAAARSAQVQTRTAAVTPAQKKPENDKLGKENTAPRKRTSSVSTGVQTADLTFTKPSKEKLPPEPARESEPAASDQTKILSELPALATAEVQTETDQSWVELSAKQRDGSRIAERPMVTQRGDATRDQPEQPNNRSQFTNGVSVAIAETTQHVPPPAPVQRAERETEQTAHPLSVGPVEDTPAAETNSDGDELVMAPTEVSHPEILCTDIRSELCVPVVNRTAHWVQLIPSVSSVELNDSPLPPEKVSDPLTVSLRTRTLLDGHQEGAVHVTLIPRVAGRITVYLTLCVESIERRTSGPAGRHTCQVRLRMVSERPAVELLLQEPGLLDFGTLPENCRKVVPLTLVNLSRAPVPVTLSVMSAGRVFHLPDGELTETPVLPSAAAPTRLTSTLAQFTLPPVDPSSQGISPVTLNVALLTPALDGEQGERECPLPELVRGSLEVELDGAVPPTSEPLLRCRLLATVGRVKLRTRVKEPLELRCRPAQTASVNLPMKNAGNIPLELRLSVTGLRDSVWVRPDHVTVPPRGERDVMLTFQPRDRHSGGRGQLLLTVQPDGTVYEVDIVGVIGDSRTVDRLRPSSPEMKSARRHSKTRKRRSPSRSRSASRSKSRSASPRPPLASGRGGGRDGHWTEVRDTSVQTSVLALAPAGDGPAAPAPAPAQPALRQPAEPPPQPPKSHRVAAPALHSNKRLLLWTGVRRGRPAARTLVLRNSSETDGLSLRLTIVNGPQFTFRMFDEEDGGGGGGTTTELHLPARSGREVTLVYQPNKVEVTAAALVIKPVVRQRGAVGSKFTIPLVAYSGASDVQLSVSLEKGLQLGELSPGATVRAPLTLTNVGDRRAFVTVLAYRDSECQHPATSSEFSAIPARVSLSPGEVRQVALVLRVLADQPPPATLRVLSGDELLRQAIGQLSSDQPLSSRLPSPGLMAVDFTSPFEGEQEPAPLEMEALRKLPSVADTFFSCMRQTRLPIRATLSSRAAPIDCSDVFTVLHADDTMASILNNTSFANVTRETRRPVPTSVAPAVTRAAPTQRSCHTEPSHAAAQNHLNTSQRPVRLPAPALRGPPVSEVSVESGPVGAELLVPPPPILSPPCGGVAGRPAPLQLASDQVTFPTTAVGQRSAASLGFTNSSGVGLRWTLEALVKPWIQSTPRACDLTQVGGDVFRFHPTQGDARPGQTVSLAARFSPPAAGYFTQTFYLVTSADTAPVDSNQAVQPSCLLVRVAGQAISPAAAAEPDKFPLSVEPDTIEFPPNERAVKLAISNRTRVDYELDLHVSGPFSVNHERMLSRARRYIHLPVFFQPPGTGVFTGRLTLSLTQPSGTAPRCFHVTLLGEVP